MAGAFKESLLSVPESAMSDERGRIKLMEQAFFCKNSGHWCKIGLRFRLSSGICRPRRGCLQRLSRLLKLLRGNVSLIAHTLPFIREIHSFGGYNSEQRSFRGEDRDNICFAFDLSVNAFHNVGRSETPLHFGRSINDGKAFFDVFFEVICLLERQGKFFLGGRYIQLRHVGHY